MRPFRELPSLSTNDVARFNLSYHETATGCYEWDLCRYEQGYGRFTTGGHCWLAHRISYQIHVGKYKPEYVVRHIVCDNPPCVNPNHLSVGTQLDNVRDCIRKGRSNYGVRNSHSKLTSTKVIAIRSLVKAGYSYASIAPQFGIRWQSVQSIVDGNSYGWLDDNGYDKRAGRCVV